MKRIGVVALVLLLLPATALAKGTNIRLSAAPNGTDAGEPWFTNVIVTMPGNGRLGGVSPRMIIRKGSVRQTFRTYRTAKKGVYRARVVFPSRGTWRYGVDDGFDHFEHGAGRVHRFPPVMIAADQPTLAKAPRPISGDISDQLDAEQGTTATGQLPPETYVVPGSKDDGNDSDGSNAMFPALAFVLAAAVGGPVWLRRRRNNKRAT